MIANITATDMSVHPCVSYKVYINAYWVTITKGETVVFKREPSDDKWLDTRHRRITKALEQLEEALLVGATSSAE